MVKRNIKHLPHTQILCNLTDCSCRTADIHITLIDPLQDTTQQFSDIHPH